MVKVLVPCITKVLEVFVFCYAGEFLSAKVRDKMFPTTKVTISGSRYVILFYTTNVANKVIDGYNGTQRTVVTVQFVSLLCNLHDYRNLHVVQISTLPNNSPKMHDFKVYYDISSDERVVQAFILLSEAGLRLFQSKSISDAVYESLWYDMPLSDSRVLLLMMMRSQKRLTITAGKVVDLTLEGFTNVRRTNSRHFFGFSSRVRFFQVMKTCGSYMSVLYAMY